MRRLPFYRCAALLLGVGLAPLSVADVARGADAEISDQIVVRLRADASPGERAELRADAGVQLDRKLQLTGVEVVETSGSRAAALAALRGDPDVLWAEPNQLVTAATDDPLWPLQYGLENTGTSGKVDADVDITSAWTVSRGSGVTVGVVDSGVDSAHPDLAGQLVAGVNFVADGQATTADGHGHGTHVSGIVAAVPNNKLGVSGAAPLAKVQPLRALDATGNGSTATVATAFAYAGDAGLRVVNASLGSTAPTNVERQAIQTHPNTLFVVAAGNSSVNVDAGGATAYPCRYTYANVLCVGASTANDTAASFSNTGATSVDLFAPGDQIASTYPASRYATMSGTSMASPLVAAAAALVASANPTWTAAQIKAALLTTVDHPAALAGLSVTGGRLNAARALGVDVGPDGSVPATTPPAPTYPAATTPIETTPDPGQQKVDKLPTPDPSSPTTPAPADPGGATTVIAPLPDVSDLGTPVASAQPAPPTGGATVASHLTRVRVTKVGGKPRGLRFHLSAAGSVTISAKRSRTRSRRALTRTRTLKLPAGPSYVPLDRSPSGIALRAGTWAVTIAGEQGRGRVVLTVR